MLILEPKAKKSASDATADRAAAPAKRLSKSQKRKLRKIEEDKAKRAERAQVPSSYTAMHRPSASLEKQTWRCLSSRS